MFKIFKKDKILIVHREFYKNFLEHSIKTLTKKLFRNGAKGIFSDIL